MAPTTTLSLGNEYRFGKEKPNTPNTYFAQRFPQHTQQFGPAFLELMETDHDGINKITPLSINLDFFASLFSDPRLNLSVIYFEPEMQFYYNSWFDPIYKPTTPEKLQNLYRGFLLEAAQSLAKDVNILNLFLEFRSDKVARQVTTRAKSVLAADSSYFSATSKHQRVRGVEIFERLARKFVEEMLISEPGQKLILADAFECFRKLLKERDLPDIKRSDFKAVIDPLIREQFNVALRNDLDRNVGGGIRGWKDVKLIQTGPSSN
ncbi:unnamed protein product [Sphagnum balticum]